VLRRLEEAPAGSRRDLLVGYLREEALRVLGLSPAHPLSNEQALSELGLDSLLAVELRNAVGAGLGRTLPAALLYNYPSIAALSGKLLEELFPAALVEQTAPADAAMKLEIEHLSEDELDDLLSEFADQHLKGSDA
jgi:acyl carrier protein